MSSFFLNCIASGAEEPGECPDGDLICGYVEARLFDSEVRLAEKHLTCCAKCRQRLVFAAMAQGATPREARTGLAPGRIVRLAMRNALGALVEVFEGVFDPAAFIGPRVAPVFRGHAPEPCEDGLEPATTVVLGPYRLRMRRALEQGEDYQVQLLGPSGMPVPAVSAEFELHDGARISSETDAGGWVRLAGVDPQLIATIWLHGMR